MNIDLLRIIAFSFIATIHTLYYQHNFMEYNLIFSIVSTGVNLFIIISGFLLLDKEEESITFFKKRMSSLVIPFIIWNIVYIAIFKPHILPIIGGYRFAYSHFWYVYMIIGLYSITPWLQKVLKYIHKETFFIVILWFISNVLKTFLVRYHLPIINFSNFPLTGFLGYYLLGYYIKKYYKNIKYSHIICSLIAGFGITYLISYHSFYFLNKRDPAVYDKNTLGVFILSIGIATLIIKSFDKYKRNKIISTFSNATYNAYFLHVLVMLSIAKFTKNFYIITIICIPVSLVLGVLCDYITPKIKVK